MDSLAGIHAQLVCLAKGPDIYGLGRASRRYRLHGSPANLEMRWQHGNGSSSAPRSEWISAYFSASILEVSNGQETTWSSKGQPAQAQAKAQRQQDHPHRFFSIQKMNRKLFIILIIAALLRFVSINQPLWYDEAYTALLVKLPIVQMMKATETDVHPPTWYLIERTFSSFGTSETVLRLPSTLLGILAVYLSWRMAKSLRISPVAVAGMMVLSGFEIYYSNEARMYALLTVSVLLATVGALERRPIVYGIGIGLTLLSHNTSIIYVPVLALLAWHMLGFDSMFWATGFGSVPWFVWLPTLFDQARAIGNTGYWIADITGSKSAFLLAQVNGLLFPQFTPDWMIPLNVGITCALIVFPIVTAFRCLGQYYWPDEDESGNTPPTETPLTLIALAFVPMLIALGISVIWQPIMISRTLAGCLPAWFALIAWWISQPHKWDLPRCALIGATCAALLVPTFAYYIGFDRSEGMRAAIDWLAAHASPSETICHADSSSVVLTKYYYSGNVAILKPGSLRNQMSPETMSVTGIRISPPDECAWLIYVRSPLLDEEVMPAVDEVLREHHAEFAYLIFESRAARAEIWKLNDVDPIVRVHAD